ncbi:MAG: hypothetical protein R6V08_00905 [Desulfuromonadales bacterium]
MIFLTFQLKTMQFNRQGRDVSIKEGLREAGVRGMMRRWISKELHA